MVFSSIVFFLQAEDGIRDLVRSRGLGDVYKRQEIYDGICRRCTRKLQTRRRESGARDIVRARATQILSLIHI